MARDRSLTVSLDPTIVKVLSDLSRASGSDDILEELKSAVRDRKFFSDKVAEGNRILLIDPAQPGVEIVVAYS